MKTYRAEVTISVTKEVEFETDDDNDVAHQIEEAVNSGDIDIPDAPDDIKVSAVELIKDDMDDEDYNEVAWGEDE